MQEYQGAAALLREADVVVVTSHVNADGDGIGAGLALLHGLRGLGKQVRFVAPSRLAALYSFLPGFDEITVVEQEEEARTLEACEVLVSCDCGSRDRLGATIAIQRGALINLDHHASNDGFGDVNVVDIAAACSAQVVTRVLGELAIPLDARMATCCYAALVFDTGRFMHSNTNAAVFRWAAELLDCGIDAAAINRALSYTKSEHDLRIQRLGLDRLRLDAVDRRLAGIALSGPDIAAVGEPEDWGELVEIPRSLQGNQIAYLMREAADGASVRISLRANPPFEVEPVAARFGGGGHKQAAGCTFPGNLAQALHELPPLLRAQLAGAK
jgi:phosphoesterase RecJ-like protein